MVNEPSMFLKDLDLPSKTSQKNLDADSASMDPANKKNDLEQSNNKIPPHEESKELKDSKSLKTPSMIPVVLNTKKEKSSPIPDKRNEKKESDSTSKSTKSHFIAQGRTKKSIAEIDSKPSEAIKIQKNKASEDLKYEEEEKKEHQESMIKSQSLLEDSKMQIETFREQEQISLPIGQVYNPNRISFISMEMSRIEPGTSRQIDDKTERKEFTSVIKILDENRRLAEEQELHIVESQAGDLREPPDPKLNDSFMASENTFYSQRSIIIPFKDRLALFCRTARDKAKQAVLKTFEKYKLINKPVVYLILLINFFWIPIVIAFPNDASLSYQQGWCLGLEAITKVLVIGHLINMEEDLEALPKSLYTVIAPL